jgi:hypothetical protein
MGYCTDNAFRPGYGTIGQFAQGTGGDPQFLQRLPGAQSARHVLLPPAGNRVFNGGTFFRIKGYLRLRDPAAAGINAVGKQRLNAWRSDCR